MEQVSYKQRNCEDQEKINQFLANSRSGTIGIGGDEYPYVVPLNYVWVDGCIYFHGMGSGKTVRLLAEHKRVSFTVYREHGTVTDPVPCHADTSYFSVMLFGEVEKVVDHEEAAHALQVLLEKFMPGFYKQKLSANLVEKYRSGMDGNAVAVYRIKPIQVTAKENAVSPDMLFGHGGHPGKHPAL